MCLLRYTPLHRAVVRVLVRVVVDLKGGGVQRCCDLGVDWLISVGGNEGRGGGVREGGLPFVVWRLKLGWWSWCLGVARVEMGCDVAFPAYELLIKSRKVDDRGTNRTCVKIETLPGT